MHRLTRLAATAAAVLVMVLSTMAASAESPVPPLCETVRDGQVVDEAECDLTGVVHQVGQRTFEPTMGAAPDGSLWFSTTPDRERIAGVASAGVGFGASISRSTDEGATWQDAAARVADHRMPYETNDPYIYVDPGTGRIFQFHMSPILTCSILSFSDNGGSTWTTNPVGCGPTAVWDHQTMVAAKPRTLQTEGYPNIVHQCVNAVYAEMCSRSLDGGRTFTPSNVAWPNDKVAGGCGTQTGHLQAGPDGTLYLPTSDCATYPTVAVSRDDGLTWSRVRVADIRMPFDDPAVGVDGSGNVYVAFYDTAGQLYLSVSRDQGQTYGTPVRMTSNRVTASKLEMVVGDDGKIALAHASTAGIPGQWPGRTGMPAAEQNAVRWGAFMTVSTDALSGSPTFRTLEVTGTDPLFNRVAACGPGARCAYIVDFIGAAITPEGRPFGAFADGCTGPCSTQVGASNNETGTTGRGVVTALDVDLCEARCQQFGAAPAAGATGGTASTASAADATAEVPRLTTSFLDAAFRQAAADRAALLSGGAAAPMRLRG